MGAKPSVDNLLTGYVDRIPVLPESVDSGAKATEYFKDKRTFTQVSLFTNERFNRKIQEVCST